MTEPVRSADIVIAGAGPAGIAAACAAAAGGRTVAVIDDNPAEGGQIWRGGAAHERTPQSQKWFRDFRNSGARLVANTRIISGDANKRTLLVESLTGASQMRYQELIIATGARELFLPFPGWTLPNVMGVGGLQALVKSGLDVKGKTIIVAGTGPLLMAVGAYLDRHGAVVPVIAEQTSLASLLKFAVTIAGAPSKAAQAVALGLSLAGVRYLSGCWVEAALGEDKLSRVRLRRGAHVWEQPCDYLAVAYGLCPNTELASLLGCRLRDGAIEVNELQQTSIANVYCAGETTGIGGVDLSLIEGQVAGYAASGQAALARAKFTERDRLRRFASSLKTTFALRAELKTLPISGTIVCRCEDVPFRQLQPMTSWREAKLQTRCGMGPCQGRVCGPACEFLFGWSAESVRPPVFPARVESLISYEGKEGIAK
jgi:NADPH-dependent 2,4-dienoyl-CoA reductase/sulfur reductase-like enzyme